MELRQLRAFVTLADCLNFTEAAEKLFITQPALSKQIASLEESLGGELFIRNRRGAELTSLGKELHEQARALVLQADQFRRHARRVLQGESGKLAIGIGLSSLRLASSFTAQFRTLYPGVTITMHDTSSIPLIAQLLADQTQLGFLRLPVEPPLMSYKLSSDRLVLAVNPLHFPGTSEADYLSQLDQLPVLRLMPTQGQRLNRQIDQFLAFHNRYPVVAQYAGDSPTLLGLVGAGIGVAFVPESAVSIAPPEVNIIHLTGEYTEWDIGMAWNPRYSNPIRDAFIELVLAKQS
ncbi:MAG: LysR family transcriptional regulator [Gammaproteobacteria bacterium]|uniref:DNA-binding transcriptional LysR family regulator n=1 Tax=Tolumonas osonensis TaxID=675874 RepID=A0A841GPV5_9GAMM|nr:LysR family transcriptional regulator [Tolumonas osonensis]MBB6055573.1 DNA-binding transcriptional LysR family regulator [Tolumonas osonensis]NCB59699.1 LysR family transcriptional regulator [Gammaproteobacteria bacterium]